MEDLIDKRNFKEKCARSIVKYYNAHFITKEEAEQMAAKEEPKKGQKEEKAWEKDILESEKKWENIPSYGYGQKKDNDQVTEEQIKKILGEQKVDVMDKIKDFK